VSKAFPNSRAYTSTKKRVGFDMGPKNDGSWAIFSLEDTGVLIDHAAMDADVCLTAEHARQLSDRLVRWANILDKKAKPEKGRRALG
jgi:hypothetical protein